LDVLADMMMNAKFEEKELEKEKWVIIQEMKMYQDDPMNLVFEKHSLRYYWNNSFGRPVIWNEKTVLSFTSQDLHNYKNSLYTKDNLIIIVAGKWVEDEKIKKLIWNYFSSLWEKRTVKSPKFSWKYPKEHESFFKKWTEQNHLIITAPWFDGNDERRYAAQVLTSILWWNMSSRLFQNIRTKEWLCYYISSCHTACPNFWTFEIRAWMDKNRFEFWLKRIREEVDSYVKNWATQTEFNKAIWYVQWQTQMWIDSPYEMAYFLWSQYLVYNRIETLEEILEKYKKLTLNEVNQIASMLSLDNCYTYHIE
jgi:predicted Zn-dependent peptidase